MGLKYSSGESAALAAAMGNNLNVAKEAAAGLDAGVARLTGALSGGELQGVAYAAGRSLFEGAVAPAVAKAGQTVDDLHADLGVYRQADSLVAHYGVLDEDSLNDQIRQYKQMQDATQTAMAQMMGVDGSAMMTGQFQRTLDSCDKKIKELQDRLRALQTFSDSTAPLFADSAKALSVVARGVKSLNGARFDADGSLGKGTDLGWVGELNALKFSSKLAKAKKHRSVPDGPDWGGMHASAKLLNTVMNPFHITYMGSSIGFSSKGLYSAYKYWQAIKRKWKTDPEKFKGRKLFGKSHLGDLNPYKHKIGKLVGKACKWASSEGEFGKYGLGKWIGKVGAGADNVGKWVGKANKWANKTTVGKWVGKLPSYAHGQVNSDLKMMKENASAFGAMTKVGRAFKVAGWAGTALSAVSDFTGYKAKGFNSGQSAELTARSVAVSTAASAAGTAAGRVAGAALGSVGGPVGAVVGSVVGGLIGGAIGGWAGSQVNNAMDRNVKPRKQGLSWPW